LSGERRVGHGGTLDPAATGVLPISLGQGTRVTSFLQDVAKTYRAEIEFGLTTDTYDASGRVIEKGDPSSVSRDRLESALTSFCGLIQQTPPMYSAVKHRGQPLYKLARAGITVERKSRPAMIHSLKILDWRPPVATVDVVCGKGTYIRSLAYDLGQVRGCGAHLRSLVRLRCGIFDIKDAVSLPQLEDAFRYGYWPRFVYPIDSVLLHWAAMIVDDDDGERIRNGRSLVLENTEESAENGREEQSTVAGSPGQGRCRAYALDGRLLGVLRFNVGSGQWQPEKVFL